MIKRKKQKLNNPFYDPRLKARHASANRFKKFTLTSLVFSIVFLGFFLFDIIGKGIPAFNIAYVQMNITINEKSLDDTRFAIDKENVSAYLFKNNALETTVNRLEIDKFGISNENFDEVLNELLDRSSELSEKILENE